MALQSLDAAITTSATVTADLDFITYARNTQSVAEVLYVTTANTVNARNTQTVAEVLYVGPAGTTNARITQQIAEVLYVGASTTTNARITQFNVEVLYLTNTAIEADITTDGTVTADLSAIRGLTASINATGIVTANFIADKSLEANITTSALVTADLYVEASDALFVDFTATGTLTANLLLDNEVFADSTIVLTQDATAELNYRVGSLLQLTQVVALETTLNVTASSTLTLTDAVVADNSLSGVGSSTLNLTQSVSVGFIHTESASSTLNLTQTLAESRPAESVLNLTHLAEAEIGGIFESVSNTLSLSDAAATNLTVSPTGIISNLNLSQTVLLNLTGDYTIVSALTFNQLAIGSTLDGYVTLQSPYQNPQTIIVLPNPYNGNTENLVSDLLVKKSMNNIMRTYVKHNINKRMKMTFSLTRNKGLELEDFFKSHNGHDMKLTRWDAEVWRVHLITNPLDFNQPRRGAVCGPTMEIDLEFEGIKISG